MKELKSGIYIRVGRKKKDLITECTVSEIQDFLKRMCPKAFVETVGLERPLLSSEPFRMGFLLGLFSKYGVFVIKKDAEYAKYMLHTFGIEVKIKVS